jgi:hypothetical protein
MGYEIHWLRIKDEHAVDAGPVRIGTGLRLVDTGHAFQDPMAREFDVVAHVDRGISALLKRVGRKRPVPRLVGTYPVDSTIAKDWSGHHALWSVMWDAGTGDHPGGQARCQAICDGAHRHKSNTVRVTKGIISTRSVGGTGEVPVGPGTAGLAYGKKTEVLESPDTDPDCEVTLLTPWGDTEDEFREYASRLLKWHEIDVDYEQLFGAVRQTARAVGVSDERQRQGTFVAEGKPTAVSVSLGVPGGILLSHDAEDVRVARSQAHMLADSAAFYDSPETPVLAYALKVTTRDEPEHRLISEIQVSAVTADTATARRP